MGVESFLRVSIKCPDQTGTGILETIDLNRAGVSVRLSLHLENGQLTKVVSEYALDGSIFENYFYLERDPDAGNPENEFFNSFIQTASELMRFYCLADQPSKNMYLSILRQNRDLLESEIAGEQDR